MRVLKTTRGEVLDVAFSPDCRAIAAAVRDAGVFLWNLDSPNIAPVRLEPEGGYRPGGLSFSADGRQLAWLTQNGRRSYDRDTRSATTAVYPLADTHGIDHASDATGTRAVSNHRIPHYVLTGWKRTEGEWVQQWQLSTRELYTAGIYLSAAGDRFAMLTRSTQGAVWWRNPMRLEVRDCATAAELTTGTYPYSYGARLRFHPDGTQLAAIHEMTLLAWALPTRGDPRRVRNADSRKHFTALAYHPTGRHLFATSNDETVHVFDPHTLDRVTRYTWNLNRLSAIGISPDGTLAAAGSAHGDVVVWDLD